jgi:hypothetical protein
VRGRQPRVSPRRTGTIGSGSASAIATCSIAAASRTAHQSIVADCMTMPTSSGWAVAKPRPSTRSISLTAMRERKVCTRDVWAFRVAPAHEEPRSGSNNSEHDSTTDHSTNYGSGHLIRVFRDIGHIFSLLFLLTVARWSPAEKEGSKAEDENGFVDSCGTHRGGRAERRLIR